MQLATKVKIKLKTLTDILTMNSPGKITISQGKRVRSRYFKTVFRTSPLLWRKILCVLLQYSRSSATLRKVRTLVPPFRPESIRSMILTCVLRAACEPRQHGSYNA